jgi:hypothetical protein
MRLEQVKEILIHVVGLGFIIGMITWLGIKGHEKREHPVQSEQVK